MKSQPAGLLSHFERLHQFRHTHLFEAPLNNARPRSTLLQFFQMQAIDKFFRYAHQVGHKEGLGEKIFGSHQRAQLFLDIALAGHENERSVAR